MAEDEPIPIPDDTNDGFEPEDPESPTPVIPISQSSEITMEDFDANYALCGGVLYAKKTNPGQSDDGKYYAATEFSDKSPDSHYPFMAKVEGKTYYFNTEGKTSQGLFTLKRTKASITGTGNKPGDTHQNSDSKYIYMPTLNFRETVAMQVLTALIGHMPDPLSYSETTMITLVKKSFSFAREFLNQALDLREPNTKDDGDDPEPIDTPDVAAMKNLQKAIETAFIDTTTGSEPVQTSKLDRLNDALYDSQTSNPFLAKLNQLDELTPIREALIDDSGSETSSVLTELTGIKESLGTNLATINQTLGTVATNTSNTASSLNTANGKLDTINGNVGDIETALTGTIQTSLNSIESNTSNIEVDVTIDSTTIVNAINSAARLDGIDRELGSINSKVDEINGKIPNPSN